VLASRSETSRGEWKSYEGKVRVNPIGSVAYKLALVAAGRADATFTRTPKSEWDIASGAALIVEAGGRITDIDGSEMRFNKPSVKLKGFVASNALVHDEIERLMPHPDRPKTSP
jgi:myo-inositol-1(or 4)-monophosphatase